MTGKEHDARTRGRYAPQANATGRGGSSGSRPCASHPDVKGYRSTRSREVVVSEWKAVPLTAEQEQRAVDALTMLLVEWLNKRGSQRSSESSDQGRCA